MFFFKPSYQQRIWGGRVLEKKLKRSIPEGKTGESWEIVDRPEAQSLIADGPLKNQTLRQLIQERADYLLGPHWQPAQRFPLLVKWLDCRERLSLQVHPKPVAATSLNGEPKTEWWYIAAAEPDASLILGLKPGIYSDSFERALKRGQIETLVHHTPVQSGDSVLVESGCIHAIGAGNLILEVQQNSDTIYRVFDWNRKGLDGRPRKLHLEESLQSMRFDLSPRILHHKSAEDGALLAECSHFRIRKKVLKAAGDSFHLPSEDQARLLHVVQGTIQETKQD